MKNVNLQKCWEGHSHLLKYDIGDKEIIEYQLKIINECEQVIFLKTNYDIEECLSYDVTSLIPLTTYFQNYCDVYERVKTLFVNFINKIEESEHYLINLENIIVREQYCFYDIELNQIKLLYLPIVNFENESIHEKVKTMFLGLIFQNLDMNYIASEKALKMMIDQLQEKNFDIFIFKHLIENYEEKKIVNENTTTWLKKIFKTKTKRLIIAESKPIYDYKENRTIMLETIETLPSLEFADGQKITISKDRFLIGRSSQLVDFAMPEELGLGRVHAEIIKENLNYYLIDIHTKNGTYINGNRLTSQKKYKLNNGDELKFANKIAYFK